MKFKSVVNKDDETKLFLYDSIELANWFEKGFSEGSVGGILIERKKNESIYLCFGTIENPSKTFCYMTLIDNPLYDKPHPIETYDIVIMDFSKLTHKKQNNES